MIEERRPNENWAWEFDVRPPLGQGVNLVRFGESDPAITSVTGSGIPTGTTLVSPFAILTPPIAMGALLQASIAGNFRYTPVNGLGASMTAWYKIQGKAGMSGPIVDVTAAQLVLDLSVPDNKEPAGHETYWQDDFWVSLRHQNALAAVDRIRTSLLITCAPDLTFILFNPYEYLYFPTIPNGGTVQPETP